MDNVKYHFESTSDISLVWEVFNEVQCQQPDTSVQFTKHNNILEFGWGMHIVVLCVYVCVL